MLPEAHSSRKFNQRLCLGSNPLICDGQRHRHDRQRWWWRP